MGRRSKGGLKMITITEQVKSPRCDDREEVKARVVYTVAAEKIRNSNITRGEARQLLTARGLAETMISQRQGEFINKAVEAGLRIAEVITGDPLGQFPLFVDELIMHLKKYNEIELIAAIDRYAENIAPF